MISSEIILFFYTIILLFKSLLWVIKALKGLKIFIASAELWEPNVLKLALILWMVSHSKGLGKFKEFTLILIN